MKTKFHILASIFMIAILTFLAYSQTNSLPSVKIKSLMGESVDTKNLGNEGKPYLIVFFTSCCSPSIRAMSSLSENYDTWNEKYSLKIIAVCVDDSRSSKKVAPMAKGKGWQFDIYLDENSDFKRAMNLNNLPHFLLFNGNNNIVWQINGYMEGVEEEITKEIEKVIK